MYVWYLYVHIMFLKRNIYIYNMQYFRTSIGILQTAMYEGNDDPLRFRYIIFTFLQITHEHYPRLVPWASVVSLTSERTWLVCYVQYRIKFYRDIPRVYSRDTGRVRGRQLEECRLSHEIRTRLWCALFSCVYLIVLSGMIMWYVNPLLSGLHSWH